MIDQWKRVWQETVENFRRELHGAAEDSDGDTRLHAMRREIAAARDDLRRVESEVARTRTKLTREHEHEVACRRRAAAARRIGDEETARIAEGFEKRHGERRSVLARKLDAFEAERELLNREIVRMERTFERRRQHDGGPDAATGTGTHDGSASSRGREPATAADDHDEPFDRLEQNVREREAEERLESLKRRVRRSG